MKKFIYVMPLMAISLLASCESRPFDPSKIDLYKKEIMYDETGKNIVATDEYEYNDKGLCIKDTKIYPKNPNMKGVREYTYDRYENEIGLHLISYNGEEITSESWMATEYTYDKQNRVTKQLAKMSFDGEKWVDFESYEYEYQENITIEKSYDGNGDLDYTKTSTYDEKGNLVNEKIMDNAFSENNKEIVYTIDENGCTTTVVEFSLTESGEREKMSSVTEITYLKQLRYRPLKETIMYCDDANSSTIEREYDSKNRLKLYKIYDGTEEGPTPSYNYYATYEY